MTPHGDLELHGRLHADLGHHRWAAAVVTPSGTRLTTRDVDLEADLEIGSVSKGITGLLYADAIDRHEVSPSDTLGQHLPLPHCPAAGVTLAALSTHSSGLPSLPSPGLGLGRTAKWLVTQANPYGDTLDELLAQVARTRLGTPGRSLYSNIGFQLLGHATAAAAGMPYRDLVGRRLALPLGLTSLNVPARRAELSSSSVIGRSRLGRVAQPWTGEAVGPAGGIRMSITDLARLLQALLDGTSPGLTALDPVADFIGKDTRIGAGWITSPGSTGPVTWHNGATGGFRTWVGLDRAAGSAVAIVNARVKAPDVVGSRLLASLALG
ncbi:MAG: serine hydrolase domain-containing protein [Aeromicrobium sp.]